MTIAPGQRLPAFTFKVKTTEGSKDMTTEDIFGGKTVVLVGVPGAFTPTCSMNHVPGFIENFEALMRKGVDTVAVVSVNDQHVMEAWARATGGAGKLLFLADGNADFTRAVGLDFDLAAGGMGVRSRRYSMLVKDGVVASLNVEQKSGVDVSGAAHMLDELG
jgi:peroxiredoxin